MAMYGYARVSTDDQDTALQVATLTAAGCEVVRPETATGTKREGRTELGQLVQFMRKGDVLMVTKIDRLARSIRDLSNIVHELEQKGIALKAVDQPIDTSTAAGKAFLGMLGVFAEFETNIRRERQMDGIAKAKAAGVYQGRPAKIDVAAIKQLHAEGLGGTEIARRLEISRASVYRLLEAA